MKTFPDLTHLANSSLDDVLSHWAGLGYYARARNLHRCAVICLEQHDGRLPATAEELSALPGIGLSTANAIVSQSSDQPAAVLDGNVRRVLSRHAKVAGWTGSKKVQDILWKEAEDRLPNQRGADYTQAIMDLGALVCARTKPKCDDCPVSLDCKVRLSGEIDDYPGKKPKVKIKDQTLFMLVLKNNDEVLLERRPPSGIWGGLWSLPQAETLNQLSNDTGLDLSEVTHLPDREHRLTHLRMNIKPVLLNNSKAQQVKCSPQQEWVRPDKLADLGVPKPINALLQELKNGETA
jgi:A/G-specific adenine glycosylase